ncbi:MAG: hypothetical protein JSS65_05110 [Armatimonadetes bacterium]|nr:hypothetical protein [Armatimonadota bacterium]
MIELKVTRALYAWGGLGWPTRVFVSIAATVICGITDWLAARSWPLKTPSFGVSPEAVLHMGRTQEPSFQYFSSQAVWESYHVSQGVWLGLWLSFIALWIGSIYGNRTTAIPPPRWYPRADANEPRIETYEEALLARSTSTLLWSVLIWAVLTWLLLYPECVPTLFWSDCQTDVQFGNLLAGGIAGLFAGVLVNIARTSRLRPGQPSHKVTTGLAETKSPADTL